MNDTPLEFDRVMAFYKGSVFPMVFPYGPATWAEFTQRANEVVAAEAQRECNRGSDGTPTIIRHMPTKSKCAITN